MSDAPTLRRFLTRHAHLEQLDPNLIFPIEDVASACRVIRNRLRSAAFEGTQGHVGETNVHGEDQKKLDVIADTTFVRICGNSPRLAALVSEEKENATWLKTPDAGDYALYFVPLDGSSNTDVNLSFGSIFSICSIEADGDRRILKPGVAQVCAGYAIYGSSMMLILALGQGVFGITCEYSTGDFRLTHPDPKTTRMTSEFAIHASRYRPWEQPVRKYGDECLAGTSGPRGNEFNMRWTASMVADVHRIMTRAGFSSIQLTTETGRKVANCAFFARRPRWRFSSTKQAVLHPSARYASLKFGPTVTISALPLSLGPGIRSKC